ncbi:ComEA family DNA-binding protein [Desulfovermiculus halophilus]|jgi:competence ComEA-like helix-hairpin-helix protein|uniref:ComEA family DNA-binding protein n=1 Tax=Desulfovermiculus halophilus TaxID=339722 RepID=UPI0004856E2D|nr:helix-hairpin-helix domain-containing protein [Desulfovermiculus halophilus]
MTRHLSCIACCFLLLAFFVFASPLQAEDQDPININAASVEVLTELDGVGQTLAERIVAYREENPFDSPQEITEVKGIGQKTYADIQAEITVE